MTTGEAFYLLQLSKDVDERARALGRVGLSYGMRGDLFDEVQRAIRLVGDLRAAIATEYEILSRAERTARIGTVSSRPWYRRAPK